MLHRILVVLLVGCVAVCNSFVPIQHYVKSSHEVRFPRLQPLSSIPNPLDTLTSGIASVCRLPKGTTVLDKATTITSPPPKLKALYDIENSPACRKVRELITELDLVVEIVIPAAPNSRAITVPDYKYAYVNTGAGSASPTNKQPVVPHLVILEVDGQETRVSGADAICETLQQMFYYQTPNQDSTLVESDDDTKERVLAVVREIGNYVSTLCRIGRGMMVAPAASGPSVPRPQQPLVLYSYESNQFCRLVREVLTELDIPYQLRSAGKESPRRNELAATSVNGSTQCPYLLDPNTNTAMAESSVIIRYLYQTYALWTPPNELLQWVSLYILPLAKPLFLVLTPLQAGSSDKDNPDGYRERIAIARADVESTIRSAPVVVYTYGLSPFSFETKALLDNLNIVYKEVSLGAEWIPGLIQAGGSETRAALLEMTGQSSLPHVFIGGTSIGGLFSGTPGLLPLLEGGKLLDMVENANRGVKVAAA
jgi:glutaredoxin